jgi:hypothetical protein
VITNLAVGRPGLAIFYVSPFRWFAVSPFRRLALPRVASPGAASRRPTAPSVPPFR